MTQPRSVRCRHCGHSGPPAGPYCPGCGRYLAAAPLEWVATPPASVYPPAPPHTPRSPYRGAPFYRWIPRWGFPAGPWRDPDGEPAEPPTALHAARALAGTVVPLLWATAVVAFMAAGAEVWRYVLLLQSRDEALAPAAVAASDALVAAAGIVAPILAVVAGLATVLWTLRARIAAAELAGVAPTRSPRQVVLGWVVPGVNLVVPGSVLAEIEHAVLERPADHRPRPSRLLLAWWITWAVGGVLAVLTLVWLFLPGVQARADGVVLHAVLDLVATASAALLARHITLVTRLLGPFRTTRRELVVSLGPPAAPATPA
ncbi:DUF4328 domain-containing protein [Pseudonocardia sp. CA-107938]|uniref:DUF4328 domain-containing protein n=1 Tax=Pseudonocardia sp. CA-107938 TaxID=3240021 RepID=UPI003D9139A4